MFDRNKLLLLRTIAKLEVPTVPTIKGVECNSTEELIKFSIKFIVFLNCLAAMPCGIYRF